MKSVLIANRNESETETLRDIVQKEYRVEIIFSPEEADGIIDKSDLILLDSNFTENDGIDFIIQILKLHYLPVLMLTSEDDPECAVEALKVGASNYLVKSGDYLQILNTTISEAINKFNEPEEMKRTIVELKKRANELEKLLNLTGSEDDRMRSGSFHAHPISDKDTDSDRTINLVDEIIIRFKRGEINLPALPQISHQFNSLIRAGAGIKEISNLLKQDIAISSKLINISNTAYYKGISENLTITEAIKRLGLGTTKQYVEVISNRSLYITNNKKYTRLMENLWQHSFSCATAAELITETLGRKLTNDTFTMALMHDIGKLLLIQVIGELEIKGKFGREISPSELLETLDSFHGRFGAVLLKRWSYPYPYIEVAMHHDQIDSVDEPSDEFLIVHFANQLARASGYNLKPDTHEDIDLSASKSGYLLRLRPEEVDDIRARVQEIMMHVKTLL